MKTGELAALLGVSVGTVRNWIDHPMLQAFFSPAALGSGVQRDLTQSDLLALNTVRFLRASGVTEWPAIAAYLESGKRYQEFPSDTALAPDTRTIPLPQAEQSVRAAATLAERDAALAKVRELEAALADALLENTRLAADRDKIKEELLREQNEQSQRFLREIADLNREIGRLEGRLGSDKPSTS